MDLHRFLQNQYNAEEKDRMKTLGNIVVPQQAFLGMSVLTRLLDGSFF